MTRRTVLRMSAELSLPIDVAGEAMGILATRGAGKSYTSAALVEELYEAKVQFAVLDPTGVYWGLRAAADGDSGGLPIIVLGGPHGDVALEPTAGALIADVLVDTGQSLILDLSDFESKGAQTRFVTAFAERLYTRKARERSNLHLIVDEADEFAPQKTMRDEARMLGAMERVVRRGRSRGLGVTLITQRSAAVNKNVLDVVDTLIIMRMLGPRDRKAVADWIAVKSAEDEAGVLDSLPSLPTGTAWVWSPIRGLLKRAVIRRIRTFDSYATPKPGQAKAEPRVLAPINVSKLGAQIEATKERAKTEDPKELRRQIADLRRQLAARQPERVEIPVEIEVVREVVPPEMLARIGDLEVRLDSALLAVEGAAEAARLARKIGEEAGPGKAPPRATRAPRAAVPAPRPIARPAPVRAPARPRASRMADPATDGSLTLSRSHRKILDALAWWEVVGIATPSKGQVAYVAGYRVSKRVGGRYGNLLGELRASGLVDYPTQGAVSLTEAGRAEAEPPDIPPTTEALQGAVLARLSGSERRILQVLIDAYPKALSKQEVADRSGYTAGERVGGRYGNLLGTLRSLGLIDYPAPGQVAALPILFLDA